MMELIQVRVDSETKKEATALFEELGLDLSTAIRSFLKKAIAVGGIPFEIRLGNNTRRAMEAVRSMRETSEANGNRDMTLDEINSEIAAARRERKEK